MYEDYVMSDTQSRDPSEAQKSPVHETTPDASSDATRDGETKRDPEQLSRHQVMKEDLQIADSDEDVGGPVRIDDPDLDTREDQAH
jgi:hypothetical protein